MARRSWTQRTAVKAKPKPRARRKRRWHLTDIAIGNSGKSERAHARSRRGQGLTSFVRDQMGIKTKSWW